MNRALVTATLLISLLGGASAAKPFPDWQPRLHETAPTWLAEPGVAIDIKWVRAYSTRSEVRDGVCILFLSDEPRDIRELETAEDQIAQCIKAGAAIARGPIPAGATRLHWYQVIGRDAVKQRWRDLSPVPIFAATGFYLHPDPKGPCYVVTDVTRLALRHEALHCLLGAFHDHPKQTWIGAR